MGKIRQTIRDSLRRRKKSTKETTSTRSKSSEAKKKQQRILAANQDKTCFEHVESHFLDSDHITKTFSFTTSNLLADSLNFQENDTQNSFAPFASARTEENHSKPFNLSSNV